LIMRMKAKKCQLAPQDWRGIKLGYNENHVRLGWYSSDNEAVFKFLWNYVYFIDCDATLQFLDTFRLLCFTSAKLNTVSTTVLPFLLPPGQN
jgi:hypothetical protein